VTSSLSTVFCTVKRFLEIEFDYTIPGGGTAGLVLTSRLIEDPTINVGVLEAGEAKIDDSTILTPLLFRKLEGNDEHDWMMKTVPQAGTKDKTHAISRGKVMGGSSVINFVIYLRGQRSEYDDWGHTWWYRWLGLVRSGALFS
jgi:choline dehydrogenase-like flavoprotein